MTITPDSIVVDLATPDMTRESFVASLAGTPAAASASASYDLIAQRRGSHAFLRSIFRHESSDGTRGICATYKTKSPGNTRSVRNGLGWTFNSNQVQVIDGVPIPPAGKGVYAAYAQWPHGFDDVAWRLVDSTYVYAQEGRRSIKQIIERFAPATDNNVPAQYIDAVVTDMNKLVTTSPQPSPDRPLHVALSAGHHNTSGGDAVEVTQTGPLTAAIARACRARGFEVRTVQDHDGMGSYPGTLSQAAQVVVDWDRAGWPVDVFLEAHTEGAGGARGAFAIYPDWGDDVDADVREKIGPSIVQRLNASTGMPIRNVKPPGQTSPVGVMSEKQTGVGAQGFRLGIFRVTEPLRAETSRLIVEFGAHDNAQDMAIFNSPGFLTAAGNSVADAFVEFFQTTTPVREFWLPGAQYPFVLGFAAHVERIGAVVYPSDPALGALAVFGYPEQREYVAANGHAYQTTERYVLEYQPGVAPPFDIVGVQRDEQTPPPVTAAVAQVSPETMAHDAGADAALSYYADTTFTAAAMAAAASVPADDETDGIA